MKRLLPPATLSLLLAAALSPALHGADEDYEKPPFSYSTAQPRDIVMRLQDRLTSGEFKMSGDGRAVLRAVLEELHVPIATQMLVFSKTSLQRSRINPDHPRALYFSDTCYVGWVPGGLIELTAIDPQLGPIFYSFDPSRPTDAKTNPPAATGSAKSPAIVRDNDCLRCHGGTFVRGIPGVFTRSVFPDVRGEPLLRHGSKVVDDRTPFEERWGGWYVTGLHSDARHRGNVLGREDNETLVFDPDKGANVTDLAKLVDTERYLTGTSDIVALLVFEHQTAVQNAITQAGYDSRRMLHYQEGLQRAMKEPVTSEPTYDSVKSVFASATRNVVDALLSKDAAPLPPEISGRADFAAAFQAGVPRDRAGHSLKDLHLAGRIFTNRCSYLIYSEMFLALPAALKRDIYAQLARALDPAKPDARYSYLEAPERVRIATILRETHPELKTLWSEAKGD